jgi:hypothetical protein
MLAYDPLDVLFVLDARQISAILLSHLVPNGILKGLHQTVVEPMRLGVLKDQIGSLQHSWIRTRCYFWDIGELFAH